jgi:hypothetical protein
VHVRHVFKRLTRVTGCTLVTPECILQGILAGIPGGSASLTLTLKSVWNPKVFGSKPLSSMTMSR